MKNVAVVLSGCGFLDGAEITESVSTLILLSEKGVRFQIFAPDMECSDNVNHLSGESETHRKNVMVEAARIARGKVENISQLKATEFDALVFPGGFGVAKNLCNWASKGSQCDVHPEVERVILEFHSNSQPIGAICIAPALVARVLGKHNVALTIGNDEETALEIEKTGATHEACDVEDYVTDRENKVISTPAYMYEAEPHQVFNGIRGLIQELVEMA